MKYKHFLFPAAMILLFFCSCGETGTDTFSHRKNDRKIRFMLAQRHDTIISLPGCDLEISLANITGNKVRVTLRKNRLTILEKSITERESMVFAAGQKNFLITCEHMENLLVGNDFARFSIARFTHTLSPAGQLSLEQQKISAMLDLIRTSEITFIRNGKPHTATEAYNHLKIKYKRAKALIKTLDQFITEVASRSILTDKPYRVKLENRTLLMEDWLREQKKELD